MDYIRTSLVEGERLVYVARFHWIFTASGVLAVVFLSWAAGFGLSIFIGRILQRLSTEVAITDRRVLLKRGLVARNINEINIDRIEGCYVRQSIMGRLLNFGFVVIRGTGVGEIDLPIMLNAPTEFRKALDEARDHYVLKRPVYANAG